LNPSCWTATRETLPPTCGAGAPGSTPGAITRCWFRRGPKRLRPQEERPRRRRRRPSHPHRRNPAGAFLAIGIGLTWPIQFALLAAGQDLTPDLLLELVFLLGGATLISAWTGGRAGVRRLFAGAVRWRIGFARFLVFTVAMPVLTLAVADVTGTLHRPGDGWGSLLVPYLINVFLVGVRVGNVWEETAWAGFLQSRLMARHGLLIGSLLTTVP
jgi:membrane protease YdiL (CAAX protease family)